MKKIFILLLSSILLVGCTKNADISKYNQLSEEHQRETTLAFAHLSNAFKHYNEKKYDETMLESQKCIDSYEKVRQLSLDGKEVAQKAKLDAWIQDFKSLSADSEQLRIKQCELIKSATHEAKQLNPDHEIVAKLINEMSDINDQFNKIQKTLNDMQNQHSKNFK